MTRISKTNKLLIAGLSLVLVFSVSGRTAQAGPNVGEILFGVGQIIEASQHHGGHHGGHHGNHGGHHNIHHDHVVYPVHPVVHPPVVIVPSNPVPTRPVIVPANVVILNPIENQSLIRFAFEGEIKTLKPGFMLDMGREGVVVFDRGLSGRRALYTLRDGTYSFKINNGGWDLVSKTFDVVLDNKQGTSDFYYFNNGKPMTLRAGFLAELKGRHPIGIEYKRNNTDTVKKRLTSGIFIIENTPTGTELVRATSPVQGVPVPANVKLGQQMSQQNLTASQPLTIE
jgi:hypothetical protein